MGGGENVHETIAYESLKCALEKNFGGKWTILVRAHFKEKNEKTNIQFNSWLVNASSYPDMQELLAVVDAGMTDYSSWAYDYILTGRPLFLYVPDLEDYDQSRGFYYPIESTPFPIAKDNEQLITAIESFDKVDYLRRVNAFLAGKGCYEDGMASKRIVEKLKEIMHIDSSDSTIT